MFDIFNLKVWRRCGVIWSTSFQIRVSFHSSFKTKLVTSIFSASVAAFPHYSNGDKRLNKNHIATDCRKNVLEVPYLGGLELNVQTLFPCQLQTCKIKKNEKKKKPEKFKPSFSHLPACRDSFKSVY